VSVVTNIPGAGSTVTLQIKGELWQLMQAMPNSAMFGNVSTAQTKDGPVVRKLTLINNGDPVAKLGEIKPTNAAFKGEIKDLEPGKKWELIVTLATPLPTGVQSGMLELATGLAEFPKLQIACSAYLVADVDVVPNKMLIPATRAVNLQRDFYVRNNGTKPLKVYDVAASNPMMKMGLQETQTGMNFRITMEVPPDYKVPKEGDQITFKTDNPNFPTIKIPITEAPGSSSVPNTAVTGPVTPGATSRPVVVGPKPADNPPIVQGSLSTPKKPQAPTAPQAAVAAPSAPAAGQGPPPKPTGK
jgi:hypothetical protein